MRLLRIALYSRPAGAHEAVTEDLTILRTKALALELSQRPNVALHVIIHRLAEAVFYRGGNGKPYDYGDAAK